MAAGVTADLLVQLRIVQCKAAVRSKHLMPKGGGGFKMDEGGGERLCMCVSVRVCECVCE